MDAGAISNADTKLRGRLHQNANIVPDAPVIRGEFEATICRLRD